MKSLDPERPDPLEHLPYELGEQILHVARAVREAGGRAWLVGGVPRDALLGIQGNDADLEVFGIEPDPLESLLSDRFEIVSVGKSFGVYKLRGHNLDISLPRRENKHGRGHRGFQVEGDPYLSRAEAASRRDFTINAISWDPLTHSWADPLGGISDLEARRLRACGPKFAEDPLRVLRAMQMIARFDLEPEEELIKTVRGIRMEDLPPERLWEEWKKLMLKGVRISRGLDFLKDSNWVRYFPELEAMIGCEQEPEWHPEGDVWTHTGHCMDAFAAARIGNEKEDLVVGFAVLCHDIGKPAVTRFEAGRIRSRQHPEFGESPTRAFLGRLTRQQDFIEAVVPLVREHHRPFELYRGEAGDQAIRRLARRVGRIDRLVRVARADRSGRPPLPGAPFPEADWLLEQAERLKVTDNAPSPLVQGRHLIRLGMTPGPAFGPILEACYEAQLDGTFFTEEDGIAYARELLKNRSTDT